MPFVITVFLGGIFILAGTGLLFYVGYYRDNGTEIKGTVIDIIEEESVEEDEDPDRSTVVRYEYEGTYYEVEMKSYDSWHKVGSSITIIALNDNPTKIICPSTISIVGWVFIVMGSLASCVMTISYMKNRKALYHLKDEGIKVLTKISSIEERSSIYNETAALLNITCVDKEGRVYEIKDLYPNGKEFQEGEYLNAYIDPHDSSRRYVDYKNKVENVDETERF